MPHLLAMDAYGAAVLYDQASVREAEGALFKLVNVVPWKAPQNQPLTSLGLANMACERRYSAASLGNVDLLDMHTTTLRGVKAQGLYEIGLGREICAILNQERGAKLMHYLGKLESNDSSEVVKYLADNTIIVMQTTTAQKYPGVYHMCTWSVLDHPDYNLPESKGLAQPRYLLSIKLQQQGLDTRMDIVRAVQWRQSLLTARPATRSMKDLSKDNAMPLAIINAFCKSSAATHPSIEAATDRGSRSMQNLMLHRANVAMHILTNPPSSESARRFSWTLHGQSQVAMAWSTNGRNSSTSRLHFHVPHAKPATLARTFCDPEFKEMCSIDQLGMALIRVSKIERARGAAETCYSATYRDFQKSTVESLCCSAYVNLGRGKHVGIQWPAESGSSAMDDALRLREEMFVLCTEKGSGCDVQLHHEARQPLGSVAALAGRKLGTLKDKLMTSKVVQHASGGSFSGGQALPGVALAARTLSLGSAPSGDASPVVGLSGAGSREAVSVESAFMGSLAAFLESWRGSFVLGRHASWDDPYHGPFGFLLLPGRCLAGRCLA